MNNKEIIKQVSDYYSQKVLSHGATPEGVDWNGEESQNVRFSQLLKITDKRDGISINDIFSDSSAIVHTHAGKVFLTGGNFV